MIKSKETIDIYTDSSHTPQNKRKKKLLGYSGVILTDDKDYILSGTIKTDTIKGYFKLKSNNININHGELIAILKSLWQFRNTSYDIRIFSDSDISLGYIKRLLTNKPLKAKYRNRYNNLVNEITKIINKINNNGGSVELNWIKGHSGIYGNTIADRMAKKLSIPRNKKIDNFDDYYFYSREINEFKEYLKSDTNLNERILNSNLNKNYLNIITKTIKNIINK